MLGWLGKGQGQSQSHCTECTARGRGMVCLTGIGAGGSPLAQSLKAVGNLGRGGALDDSSDYFGKCPVICRKKWVEANLACERRKK